MIPKEARVLTFVLTFLLGALAITAGITATKLGYVQVTLLVLGVVGMIASVVKILSIVTEPEKEKPNWKEGLRNGWLFYGFLGAMIIAATVANLAAIDGRLPFAMNDGRTNLPLKEWELLVIWTATAIGFYLLGADHWRSRTTKEESGYSTPDGKPDWT